MSEECETSLQIHQPYAHYIFDAYLYHPSATCFGVFHTIFRENYVCLLRTIWCV